MNTKQSNYLDPNEFINMLEDLNITVSSSIDDFFSKNERYRSLSRSVRDNLYLSLSYSVMLGVISKLTRRAAEVLNEDIQSQLFLIVSVLENNLGVKYATATPTH